MDGKTISYQELGGGRFMVGRYLHRIALEERAAWRPPLTSLVVTRRRGRPGARFHQVMREIEYPREGESEDDVWRRAVGDVHDYWRSRLTDDLRG